MTTTKSNYFENLGAIDAIAAVNAYSTARKSALPSGWTSEKAAIDLPLWGILEADRADLRSRRSHGNNRPISDLSERAAYRSGFLSMAAKEVARIYKARVAG